jgi:hypothetical protein
MGARFLIRSNRVSILISHRYCTFGQSLAFFAVFCIAWFNADARFGERYP